MNKDYIHKRRLFMVADLLDSVPEEQFDYTMWVGKDWKGKANLSCGTTACAFGWATTIPALRRLGLRLRLNRSQYVVAMKDDDMSLSFDSYYRFTQPAAFKIFGLTPEETDWLFLPRFHRKYRGDQGPTSNASPKQVASHIRDFIAERYV